MTTENYFISVDEALKIIDHSTAPGLGHVWELKNSDSALGDFCFEAIQSPIAMPPFRQSSMDGYALRMHSSKEYKIVGESKTGDSIDLPLEQGQAVRIFTGAAVPSQADSIVIQEKVTRQQDTIRLEQAAVPHQNIRELGEQFQQGATLLEKGTQLTPAALGVLSTIGIEKVKVYKKPKIAIIVTGNELVQPGKPLAFGQVYESNSLPLKTLLTHAGYPCNVIYIPDDYKTTVRLIEQAANENDMILLSGGISVGDYDFVGKALSELEVTPLFYKVRQRPGKPLFFGKKENTLFFALPGNPASTLSCFYVYVLQALYQCSGAAQPKLLRLKLKLSEDYQKSGARAEFLKATIDGEYVHILEGQSSSMILSFSKANALAYLPEEATHIQKGALIEVLVLPNI